MLDLALKKGLYYYYYDAFDLSLSLQDLEGLNGLHHKYLQFWTHCGCRRPARIFEYNESRMNSTMLDLFAEQHQGLVTKKISYLVESTSY